MDTLMKKITTLVCGAFVFAGTASAQPPMPNVFDGGNMWKITFYNDPAPDHQQWGTQRICFLPYRFVGTSIQGVWYSPSYRNWNGLYYQEGDEVKMTGDFGREVGHDHMTLVHTTWDVPGWRNAMAFKDWTEWYENRGFGRIIGWGNAKMERIGRCPFPVVNFDIAQISEDILTKIEDEALLYSIELPERLTIDGDVATSPGQENLESIDDYNARSGLQ